MTETKTRCENGELVYSLLTLLVMAGAIFAIAVGVPLVFAVFDEDRLRMTDDFAAMTSAAIALILPLGFVEMNRLLKRARDRATAEVEALRQELAARQAGAEPPPEPCQRGDRSGLAASLVSRRRAVSTWVVTSIVLCTALTLNFLWAAIDGHGPARWLAWAVWCSTSWGLSLVLAGALGHVLKESSAILDLWWEADRTGAAIDASQVDRRDGAH
ncbi:hypothetical protein [Streptomyces tritici]|uniref:hypothetical protein n=1 Tax=Streptomyces tritici TaxID=2054410 RepID=UPI003AF1B040